MRRVIYLGLAILELGAVGVLLALVWELPGPADMHDAFGRAQRVGQKTNQQVQSLRQQLRAFSKRQPEMQEVADQLQKQLKLVSDQLGNQRMDFKAIAAVRDALGDVADGLEGVSGMLDPKTVSRLSSALATTATYLEEKVAPAAARAADQLDGSLEALRIEAESLSAAFRTVALDPESLRESLARLEQFDQALVWLQEHATAEQLRQWKQKLAALDASMNEAADRVALLAAQTYPSMTFNGLLPEVEYKPIWPQGQAAAQALRRGAHLLSLGNRYARSLTEAAPAYGDALKEMRKFVFQLRQVMRLAANQREEWAPLLRNLPENAARLAEDLPRLGGGLSRVLRDTVRLKEVADVLRQAQRGIDDMVENWPVLQKKMGRSVVVLRVTRNQLNYALEHQQEYEAALKGVSGLAQTVAGSLPVFTSQLEQDLAEQEKALGGLQTSIEDALEVLPHAETNATRIVQMARALLALLAGIVGFHAVYLAGLALSPTQKREQDATTLAGT
jgi:hypothetical protein